MPEIRPMFYSLLHDTFFVGFNISLKLDLFFKGKGPETLLKREKVRNS